MDPYGIFQPTSDDWGTLSQEFIASGSIVFSYSYDGVGAMVIHIDGKYTVLGAVPFGGNPADRIYVGIYGKGSCHFAIQEYHPTYFEEKLHLQSLEAVHFGILWSEFTNRLKAFELMNIRRRTNDHAKIGE